MSFLDDDFTDRQVIYLSNAEDDIRRLDQEIPRFSNILNSIHQFLLLSAHNGKPANKAKTVYLYVTMKRPDAPAIEVYYYFDNRTVSVMEFQKAPSLNAPE